MQQVKDIAIVIGTALLGFFHPIQDFLIAIMILLVVNFGSGLLEDELHGEGWKRKKAWQAFTEMFVLTGIGCFVFVIGHFMHNEAGAAQCVSGVCYAAIYFYCKNILKNWLKITPEGTTLHGVLGFFYYMVSLYFLEKVPGLKGYFKKDDTAALKGGAQDEDGALKGAAQNPPVNKDEDN